MKLTSTNLQNASVYLEVASKKKSSSKQLGVSISLVKFGGGKVNILGEFCGKKKTIQM